MKEWIVIHKIKSLYDNGNGLTERKIAKELGLPPQYDQQVFKNAWTGHFCAVIRNRQN